MQATVFAGVPLDSVLWCGLSFDPEVGVRCTSSMNCGLGVQRPFNAQPWQSELQ